MTPGASNKGVSQYASTNITKNDIKPTTTIKISNEYESPEEQAVKRFTAKYDSYKGILQQQQQQQQQLETTDINEDESEDEQQVTLAVTEEERLQTESFFRGLKTHIFVSSSLANLYFGTATHSPQGSQQTSTGWELRYTGIPVIILDVGETRSRRKRRIQILLAERGSCFTLWRDTIDNLTSYRQAGPGFHTMYLSSDHRRLIGLSFDSQDAADELLAEVEALTARPENISLSTPKINKSTLKSSPRSPPPKKLPPKSQISQPCCFQHVSSVAASDAYYSLQTLVPSIASKPSVQSQQVV